MKIKHLVGAALITSGVALLATAGFLWYHNDTEDRNAVEFATEQLPKVQAVMEERKAQYNDDSIQDELTELVIGTQETESPVVEIDGEGYLGILTLPSVDWETPILENWSTEQLKIAPCRYFGSPATNDLVIAGHNYKSSFGKLHSMHIGDTVFFTDMNGKRYSYTVREIEVLDGTAVQPMIVSDWDLSLYTCTYGGKQRLTVRCNNIQE